MAKKMIRFEIVDSKGYRIEVRVKGKGRKAIMESEALARRYMDHFGSSYLERVEDSCGLSGSGHCDDCGAHFFVAAGSEAVCPICGKAGYQDMDWEVK